MIVALVAVAAVHLNAVVLVAPAAVALVAVDLDLVATARDAVRVAATVATVARLHLKLNGRPGPGLTVRASNLCIRIITGKGKDGVLVV